MRIPDFHLGGFDCSKNESRSVNKSGVALLALSPGVSLFAVSSPKNVSRAPLSIFLPGGSDGVGSGVGVADGVGFGVGVADGLGFGNRGGVSISCRGIDALLEVGLDRFVEDLGESLAVDLFGEAGRSVIFTSFMGFGD